jgi:SAM-dependent methyltransferase
LRSAAWTLHDDFVRSDPPIEATIYRHPLAYLLGLEGVALMRAFAGEYDRSFTDARIAEIRELLARAEDFGPGVDVLPMPVADGYDAWARTYDSEDNGCFPMRDDVLAPMLDRLSPGRVLDAACGTGAVASQLVERGHDVVGIDISPAMLDRARKAVPGATFLLGDITSIPEIESAFLALRHTLLTGHVLRSGDRPGVEQELWAALTVCQLLRMAMVTAVETRPGTNPDRASFTTALETARQELTAARGINPPGPADLPGAIGRAVLATLLPPRRARFSARKVKCATSRYLNRDDGRPATATTITAIGMKVRPPLPGSGPARNHRRTSPTWARAGQPAATWSPPSSPASHPATGAEQNSPPSSTSPPATCTPSSANGPAGASSPAPASAPTGSTRHPPLHPRQPSQTLNYAALHRRRRREALSTGSGRRRISGSGDEPPWSLGRHNLTGAPARAGHPGPERGAGSAVRRRAAEPR